MNEAIRELNAIKARIPKQTYRTIIGQMRAGDLGGATVGINRLKKKSQRRMQQMRIAVGNSRMDKKWKNKDMSWDDFKQKCSQTIRTTETVAEYRKMSKPAQDNAKDVGGFVGGALKQGKRKNGFVDGRSMLTLDLDHAMPEVWDAVTMLFDFKCLMYSTHKHTPEEPRVRLIIPLSREVSAEEYAPVSRMVAKDIGMEMVDDTCHEAARLMYWPSTSSDGVFLLNRRMDQC